MSVQSVIESIDSYLYGNGAEKVLGISTEVLRRWKMLLENDIEKRPSTEETLSAYGYCPHCGNPGINRERRIDGNDTCSEGHVYPSSHSKDYMSL